MTDRLDVRKTYKLYLGGAFPRSESGRSYPVTDGSGRLLAHAAQASRKDVRDAVVAARKAFGGWSGASAYNRGQVLYRIAEILEGRQAQFSAEVAAAEERPLDEATGVFAPQDSSLLGLTSVLAPVIATGNTAVVIASQLRPLPAVSLGEVLATSDVPGGVVNVLTGFTAELAPWLASHKDVNAIDLTGVDAADRVALQQAAAENVKRVYGARSNPTDWSADPGLSRLTAFLETKTVWHPIGV